jgi:uncharacterized protein YjiK
MPDIPYNIRSTPFIKIGKKYKYHYQMQLRGLSLICVIALLSFCNPYGDQKDSMGEKFNFEYNLDKPDARFKLPDYLEEISGLSYYGKGKIACVQDEKANIYVLNLEQEKITKKYDFGDNADYEDIAIVENTAYVLRSNGQIFRVKDFKKKNRKVIKYKTQLNEKNDTEGIAFDPLSNSLLITCKGSPSLDKEKKFEGYKAVYMFDLDKEVLDEDPRFLIDLERLDSYIDHNAFTKFSIKVAKMFHLIESETSFGPSGIAIHPQTGEIYIISSVGKLLIVINRRGKVLNVTELDPKIFRQPEGICFSPSGDLYISSEGQGGKGYILKFNSNGDE